MKKLELKYMNPEMARTFRYLMVPSVLLDNEDYSDIDDGAKLLYSKMLERLGWSSCHLDKFTDKNGRVFILYTVENMQKDLQRSHPTIVKFTKQLEAKGLIEKVRQGQGKPSKIYIKDFASAPRKEPEKPSSKEAGPLEVKDLNFKKSKGFTSRSKDSELQEVKDFNPIELENKELENNELPSYQPPGDWKEGGVEGIADEVREQIEYDVLREEYGKELSDEVHISYALAEKSGRSYTQYLTEKEPEPTPPVNQGSTGVTKPKPTTAPTPKVTPTPKASPTAAPTATPKPTAVPTPTPIPDGQLTIACTVDKPGQAFSFEVSGTKFEGGKFKKDYKTGADGKIVTNLPAGKYTVTPKSVKGFDLPEEQSIELAGGGSAYLTFSFVANQRDLTLTVVDDDGQPVPGATIGLFEPGEKPLPEVKKDTESSTDISATLVQIKEQKAADEKRADPYTKANAIYVGKTGVDGVALIQNVPVAEFVAVPIELPDGYSSEKIATDIHAGLGTKFTVVCEYVAVDLSVWSTTTNSPVVGADLVLLGEDNTELAKWASEEAAHRLIRVPQGEYALKIIQDGQTDTVHFEVGKEKSLQEIQIETYLPGEVSEDRPQGLTLKDYEHILPFVAGGLVLLTGLFIALFIYRDSRKHSGGHR